MSSLPRALLLAAVVAATPAGATTIDPLGRVILIDPLTFDGGVLQRSGRVSGGGAGWGGVLSVAGEATFFRELSARVDYTQDFDYGPRDTHPNGHRLGWRLRLPVIQSPRFGRLDTWQFQYRQELGLGPPIERYSPAHEASMAFIWARGATGWPATHHLQYGVVVRHPEQTDQLARTGFVVRGASAVHLGQPVNGRVAAVTVAPYEVVWHHYGLSDRLDGRLELAMMCPAVHLGQGSAATSIGLMPQMRFEYSGEATEVGWGGFAVVQTSQLPRVE